MTATLRNIHIALAATVFAFAAFFAPQASAQLGDIPALIRTTIPTGDPDGGRISYSIALGEGRELRITVDAGRLVVTVAGTVKDQFKIFSMDEGEFVPLECSAGFLGAIVGNISCRDVLPGTRLVFARKDLVDQLIPEAAAGEEEFFEEEFAADEEESSLFDRALDFFGFGEEEEPEEFVGEFDLGVDGEDEFAFEDEKGEDTDFFGFGVGEDGEEPEEFIDGEEPSWFDNAVEGVADLFGFGDEEEVVEEEFAGEEFADEAGEFFEAGEEEFEDFGEGVVEGDFGAEDELFGAAGEDELVFGEEGEEFAEGEEERLLPRIWREIRETAEVVQYRVADFIAKLYVKPLPLTPEAAEEGLLLFDEGAGEDVFIDDSGEFIEEPEAFDAESAPPVATVNQAFQRFINNLGQ